MDTSQLMTVKATAAEIGRSEKTIRRWIHNGTLPAIRLGGQYLISLGDLLQSAQPVDPAGKSTNRLSPVTPAGI